MEKTVGLKELRENFETYIEEVKRGRSFVVIRRSKPVFRISSIDDEGMWETAADFTRAKKGGVPLSDLLARL